MAEKQPAVWRRALAETPELEKVQLDALKHAAGKRRFRLNRTLDGSALICYARHPVEASFEAPIENVEREPVYLSQVPTSQFGPVVESSAKKLWNELGLRLQPHAVNVWASGGDVGSPLHYDQLGNVMLQAQGEKDVYFAPPDSADSLVLCDNTWAHHVVREIAASVEFRRVRLVAGDVMYLPAEWFHATRNRSRGVMINCWFREEGVTKLTLMRLAKHFSLCSFVPLHGIAGAPEPPWLLHERRLADLVTMEQRVAAFLLSAKVVQETALALPGVRDRPPVGPDLDRLRALLPAMSSHIPPSLAEGLVYYFDKVAWVIDCVLTHKFPITLDLAALASVTQALHAYSSEQALAETRNPQLRVGWREIESLRVTEC